MTSPDERFKHVDCHEEGGPGDYVLNIADDHSEQASVNRQYQCGHVAYGPPSELPDRCPHEERDATEGWPVATIGFDLLPDATGQRGQRGRPADDELAA
jgi:hypothetical protein